MCDHKGTVTCHLIGSDTAHTTSHSRFTSRGVAVTFGVQIYPESTPEPISGDQRIFGNIAAHLLGLEVVEGGCDLIGVGRVERLHARREDLRLHRRRLQHPVRGEGGREVGRLELCCGGWGSWGRRKGRSNTVLKKSFVNIDKHLQSHISQKHIQREKGVFCWPPRIENWSG